MSQNEPSVLLIGAGYTLSRIKKFISTDKLVHASRTAHTTNLDRWVCLDTLQPETLIDVLMRFPTIRIVVDSVPPLRSDDIDRTVTGVRNVCHALNQHKIDRLIYLSTTGVFGNDDGAWVNEQSPCKPQHVWGDARLLSEEIYRQANFPVTSLRIPAIYGPGRGLGNSIKNKMYRMISEPRWSNRIHVDDLALTIAELIKHSSQDLPEVLCIADDSPCLVSEVVEFYCKTFNLPNPEQISFEQARKAGSFTQLSNQRVSNALAKKVLDLELFYPSYREGAETEFE